MTDQVQITPPEGQGNDAPEPIAPVLVAPASDRQAGGSPATASSFTARMYDHSAGQYVDVPAQDVTEAVKSGRFTFPQGYKIPTIDADGNLAETPAEAAFNDFTNHGVQYATPALSQASQQQAQRSIIQDNFGDQPLTAALAGMARGASLGASDVGLDALGVGDAAKNVAALNPGTTMLGEGLGTGLLMAGTGGLGGVGEGAAAGTKAALGALGGDGVLAQTILPAVAKEATLGSVFGSGAALSEQALGHPDDVVDNFVSHVGMGALLGGGFGAVFGTGEAVRPFFDQLAEKVANKGAAYAADALGAIPKARVSAVLNKDGEAEAAKVLGDFANDPDALNVLQTQGKGAAEKFVAREKGSIQEVQDYTNNLINDAKKSLKDATAGTRAEVEQAMQNAGYSVFSANDALYKQAQTAEQMFQQSLGTFTKPLEGESSASSYVEGLVDHLAQSESTAARSLGRKIEAISTTNPLQTVGDEAGLMFNVKSALENSNLDKIPGTTKSLLKGAVEDADNFLSAHEQPGISEQYRSLTQIQDASQAMKDLADRTVNRITNAVTGADQVSGAGYKGSTRIYDDSKVLRSFADPKTVDAANTILQQIQHFSPELKQAAEGFKNASQKQAYVEALEAKLKSLNPKGNWSTGDANKIFEMLGSPSEIAPKLDKIAQVQATMDQTATPLDRILAAKRTLGQPIDKDLAAVAKYQHYLDTLNKVADKPMMGYNPVRIGTAFAKLAHGNVLGAARDGLLGIKQSTVGEHMEMLAQVQRASQRGAEAFTKAVKTATKGLTGQAAKTTMQASANAYNTSRARKEFPKVAAQLQSAATSLQHPLSNSSPALGQAFQQRQQQTIAFLQSKLPQDPFQQASISIGKSRFVPSDQDLAKFNRYVQAANNPLQVVEKIGQGKAQPEELETLKTLYPSMLQKLQQSVQDGIISKGIEPSYKQRLQLSQLFGQPLDPSLQPDFIASLQQPYVQKNQGGRPEGSGPVRKIQVDLKPNETVATESQQTTFGLT